MFLVVYLGWVLLVGCWSGYYFYLFLDLGLLGGVMVVCNVVVVVVVFIVVGVLLWWLDVCLVYCV